MAWVTGQVIAQPRMNANGQWPLGGSPYEEIFSAAYVPIPGSQIVQLDGTNLDVPNQAEVTVHVTCYVAAGTGSFRLWNITTGLIVGTEQNFVNTAVDLVTKSLSGLIVTGVNKYRLEGKGAAATDRPVIVGSFLLVR